MIDISHVHAMNMNLPLLPSVLLLPLRLPVITFTHLPIQLPFLLPLSLLFPELLLPLKLPRIVSLHTLPLPVQRK